jgi:Mn-dependent DtxR family transcriptional regulator
MQNHEDLYIKICNDFKNELNPVLIELEPAIEFNELYKSKRFEIGLTLLQKMLLNSNGSNISIQQIINIKSILESFDIRFQTYFNSHNIATCFLYFAPENSFDSEMYFWTLKDYFLNYSQSTSNGFRYYMVGIGIMGFPTDCSMKIFAKTEKGELTLIKRYDPIFDYETEKGKQIGNPQRTRKEQRLIESFLREHSRELWEKGIENASASFKEFSEATQIEINKLLSDFNHCKELCKSLIEKKQNDTTSSNLPKIEKIYSILKNGFIQETFERFQEIFQPGYDGEKIIWYKYGYELKYFVDELRDNMKLPTEINKWTIQRFILKPPIKRFSNYLSKQIQHPEYSMLKTGNRRTHPLSLLFKEL